MNRKLKVVLVVVGGVLGLLGLALVYLFLAFPKVAAASDLKVQSTPELVARGAYLAEHVAGCLDCHSLRDWKRYSAPPITGSRGGGGEPFTHEMGFPGNFYSRNITPTALASWTDGEIARAITTGVTREGRAMFPVMPYPNYKYLCEADLDAIIAYLRTLPSVTRANRDGKLDFPVSVIVRTIPSPPEPWPCPTPGTPEYGKYMTTIAGCNECHTQQVRGKHKPGMEFAGGWSFPLPSGGHVSSANITPDPETGIGNWTRDEFIAKFKAFANPNAVPPVSAGGMNTIMPWTLYAGMTPEDLGAIYDYLRKQQPVRNVVERFRP